MLISKEILSDSKALNEWMKVPLSIHCKLLRFLISSFRMPTIFSLEMRSTADLRKALCLGLIICTRLLVRFNFYAPGSVVIDFEYF